MTVQSPAIDIGGVKALLLARRAEITQRLGRVDVDRLHRAEPLSADFAEQASQTSNDEVRGAIGDALRTEIADIDTAIERLASGRYGVCAGCGQAIDRTRLELVPYTQRCAACAA